MQSIKEIPNKIKTSLENSLQDNLIFTILAIILVAICSFGLGRLSKTTEGKTLLSIHQNPTIENLANISNSLKTQPSQIFPMGGKYVASKNSDKYHAPWCSGAQRIKTENQIWFNNKTEAETAGYTPASNCKGI